MELNDFNSRRLKSARIFRGKSIEQISEETEITKANLLAFEDGRYIPKEDKVRKLAEVLNFPLNYFFYKDEFKVVVDSKYKAQIASNRIENIAYKERLVFLHHIQKILEEYIDFPKLNLPENKNRFSDVEDLATKTRSIMHVGKGPIKSMIKVLENNGIIVSDANSEKSGTVTFSQKQSVEGEERFIVSLGNDNKSASKRNYMLALELGSIIGNNLEIPAKRMPKEEFACAFLLPRDAFLNDLKRPKDLKHYIQLKKIWKVPIELMIMRAYQLYKLDYKSYVTMMKEYEAKGWNKEEPLEKTLKDTTDPIIKHGIIKLIDSGELTQEELLDFISDSSLALYTDDVELILGFKQGRFR